MRFVSFQIDYPIFEKNFYIEHEEIARLTEREVQDLRRKLGMKVYIHTCMSDMHGEEFAKTCDKCSFTPAFQLTLSVPLSTQVYNAYC